MSNDPNMAMSDSKQIYRNIMTEGSTDSPNPFDGLR